MKSMLISTKIALMGLLMFSNAFAQTVTDIPTQEIPAEYEFIAKIGDVIPDFTMTLTNGKKISSKDWSGKVVMLQFTASWCGVCRTEMPFIEKEIWLEKKDKGLAVIGIDRDEPVETVLKFKKDIGVTYPLALDPGAGIFALFAEKSAGVTRNVIIDKKGKIIFLTRLYKREEFDEMKKVIFMELE